MKYRFLNFPQTISVIFEMQIFKYLLIRFIFCTDIGQVGKDIMLNKA